MINNRAGGHDVIRTAIKKVIIATALGLVMITTAILGWKFWHTPSLSNNGNPKDNAIWRGKRM